MADERQEIEIKFNTNATSAAKDVNKLTDEIQEQKDLTIEFQKELAKLERQLKETPTNSLAAQKQLKGEISNLKDAIKDQGLAVKSLSNEKTKAVAVEKKMASAQSDTVSQVTKNGGAIAILNQLTNGYAQVVKDSLEAMVLFGKESKIGMAIQKSYTVVMGASTGAMKAFKIALISTGIGAIALALVALIVNFEQVKEAVYKLIPGLKSVGDFFGKIITAVTDFVGITSEAERQIDKLNKASQRMLEDNANLLANFGDQLSDFQKKQVDISKSLADRIKEISEDEKLTIEQKNEQIKLAQERAKRDLLKNIDDTNSAAAEKRKAEEDKQREEREKKKEEIKAYNEKLRELTLSDEERKKELKAKLALEDFEAKKRAYQSEQEWEEEQEQKEIEAEDLRLQRQKENSDKEIEIEKAKQLAIKEVQDAAVRNVENIGKNLQVLAGKNKAVAKAGLIVEGAVGAAKIVSSTMEGNAKAVAAFPLTGGMPFTAINTVSGALSLAAQVKSVNTGLAAIGGGGSSTSSGMPTPTAASPAVSFNNTAENQIGQSVARTQSDLPPIEVFVQESEITKAQNNVKVLETNNVF